MLSRGISIFVGLSFLFLVAIKMDSATMMNDKLRGSELVRSLMEREVVEDCGMMKKLTEEEVAHYADIMEIMKVRWAKGMTPEMEEKVKAMHEDHELMKSIKNEFMTEWVQARIGSGSGQNENDETGMGYLNKEGFRDFNERHLSSLMRRLGWSPEFSVGISDRIWEAIYTSPSSEHNKNGISLHDFLRYHKVMKDYMHSEKVTEEVDQHTNAATEEDEVAHYANIMEIMRERWAEGMTPEMKKKSEAMHEDPVLRDSIKNEFMTEWIEARIASGSGQNENDKTGLGFLNKEGFRDFNKRHLSSMTRRLGWSPEFSVDISDKVWEAICSSPLSEHNKNGISLHDFIRYHKVMKNDMHKEVVTEEADQHTNAATEEDEVAHYAKIMEILRVRWAVMTPEKLAVARGDPMFKKSIKEDFLKEWREARTDSGSGRNENDESDVGYLNEAGFRDFHEKHLLTIKRLTGWAPEFSEDISNKIWDAIYSSPWSEHNKDGISVHDFRRYQKVIKNNLHKETVKEEADHYVKQEQAVM